MSAATVVAGIVALTIASFYWAQQPGSKPAATSLAVPDSNAPRTDAGPTSGTGDKLGPIPRELAEAVERGDPAAIDELADRMARAYVLGLETELASLTQVFGVTATALARDALLRGPQTLHGQKSDTQDRKPGTRDEDLQKLKDLMKEQYKRSFEAHLEARRRVGALK